jgi:hypothetical protein
LYWNFGWLGALLGMPAMGAFLGWVAGRFNFEQGPSLTRLMVFIVTVNEQVVLFEGEVSNSYVVWLRSIAAIWLLHKMFARNNETLRARESDPLAAEELMGSGSALAGAAARLRSVPRYPNVLQ